MTGNRKTIPAGDDSGTNLHPSELPTELIDPAAWWRRPCEVDDRLYVCGDLPSDSEGFQRVLGEWLEAGITHIVDVRSEWSDADRVADAAPDLTSTWLGTHDDGGIQEAAWFDAGVACVGLGSKLVTKEIVGAGDFDALTAQCKEIVGWSKEIRVQAAG